MSWDKRGLLRYAPSAALALAGLALIGAGFGLPWVGVEPAADPGGAATVVSDDVGTTPAPALANPTATAAPATATPAPTLSPTPSGPTPVPTRTEVIVYTVQPGDFVWNIGMAFNIDDDTIIWANPKLEKDPDWLAIGEELCILPVVGTWHTVREGDTLDGIAAYYQASPQDIVSYEPNKLSPGAGLVVGQKLIVPGGVKPYVPRTVDTGSGVVAVSREDGGGFVWPCYGTITTQYGPDHQAIDIGVEVDTPLYASAAGAVTQSGANGTLGLSVTVDHGDGYVTVYGHMDYLWVRPGQNVRQGQKLGAVGSTGKSTGPHVHFIVLYQGAPVDPMTLLSR